MRKLGISIGEGTVIRSGVELNLPHIEIGKNVFINYGCQFNTGWGGGSQNHHRRQRAYSDGCCPNLRLA